MHKITEKDIEFIKENWGKMSQKEMATKLNICDVTLRKIEKSLNINRINTNYKWHNVFTKEWLMDKYVIQKMSQEEIGNMVNCHQATVYYWLKKHNILARKPTIKFTKKYLLKEYIENKRSLEDIGKEYRCSGETVANYCKKYNIQIRTPIEQATVKIDKKLPNNDNLAKLYKSGYSAYSIAHMFGCDEGPIYKRLNKLGICTAPKHGELNPNFKGYKDIAQRYYTTLKIIAIIRGYDFNISKKDIYDLYILQEKKCALTNMDIEFNPSTLIKNTASVDRINNNIGYEKNNIQIVHKNINKIRSKLSITDFISWCRLIASPLKNTIHSNGCSIINNRPGNFTGYKNITGNYFTQITRGSYRHNKQLDFKITIKYIWKLFIKQKGYCAITGYQLEWGEHNKTKNKVSGQTASLDRIDSTKGYIPGNVQWVHKDINLMKWDIPQDEFIHWCKLVANHTSTPEWQEKYGYLLKDECATN